MEKKLKSFPHKSVFTYLRPSVAEKGEVGVFAIVPIPVATNPFPKERGPLYWVSKKALRALKLPRLFWKIYNRLGACEGNRLYVPHSWNGMYMSWYICDDAENPNLRYNVNKNRFYTMRDIEVGEELTVDYETIG